MVTGTQEHVQWTDFPDEAKDAARLVRRYGIQIGVDVDNVLRDRGPPRKKVW